MSFLKQFVILLIVCLLGAIIYFAFKQHLPYSTFPHYNMHLKSSSFDHNQPIPAKYTCNGDNINPPLYIYDVPEPTQSLVLIMEDPDAPAGTWVHWTLWNINPSTKEIKENSVPSGAIEGLTSFAHPGYGGPCPPSGTHRYFFRLYALDISLVLPVSTNSDELKRAIENHVLDSAELIGIYSHSAN